MLYQQLIRVNEIDSEIANLHKSLMGLYAERATLVQAGIMPEEPLPSERLDTKSGKPSEWEAEASYAALQQAWSAYSITLPGFKTLRRKLKQACSTASQLEADNTEFTGKLSLVAVPPSRTLEKALRAASEERAILAAIDSELFIGLPRTTGWTLVLVMDISLGVQVDGLQAFLANQGYTYKAYDCRGLGLAELAAAELQGVKTVAEDGWTLLLKDYQATAPVLCAQYIDGQIILDTDDADCLLDDNYLQPAIHIA